MKPRRHPIALNFEALDSRPNPNVNFHECIAMFLFPDAPGKYLKDVLACCERDVINQPFTRHWRHLLPNTTCKKFCPLLNRSGRMTIASATPPLPVRSPCIKTFGWSTGW